MPSLITFAKIMEQKIKKRRKSIKGFKITKKNTVYKRLLQKPISVISNKRV